MTDSAQQSRDGGVLAAGTRAPDFTLHSTPDQTLSLGELRGRAVILAFYPADWSPVCGDEMALFNQVLPERARIARGIRPGGGRHLMSGARSAERRERDTDVLHQWCPLGRRVVRRGGVPSRPP
jgi:hypothetical protein